MVNLDGGLAEAQTLLTISNADRRRVVDAVGDSRSRLETKLRRSRSPCNTVFRRAHMPSAVGTLRRARRGRVSDPKRISHERHRAEIS